MILTFGLFIIGCQQSEMIRKIAEMEAAEKKYTQEHAKQAEYYY